MSDSLRFHGLQTTRLLCPWNSLGKNTGVGSLSLLQGIFPTQGLNLGLPHSRQILHHLSHKGSCVFLWCVLIFYMIYPWTVPSIVFCVFKIYIISNVSWYKHHSTTYLFSFIAIFEYVPVDIYSHAIFYLPTYSSFTGPWSSHGVRLSCFPTEGFAKHDSGEECNPRTLQGYLSWARVGLGWGPLWLV